MLHGIELCGVLSLYQKGCEDCVSVGGQKLHFRNYSRIETTLCGCKGIVRRSLENLFQKACGIFTEGIRNPGTYCDRETPFGGKSNGRRTFDSKERSDVAESAEQGKP